MEKTMMIINPASGNGRTGKKWPQMESYLRNQGLDFDIQMTGGSGEATTLTRQALYDGYNTIVSVGGDGTLNETLNGFIVDDNLINPLARLGVLCCGTGGDFIRTAGIPRDLPGATALLCAGKSRLLDVGKISYISHEGEQVSRYYLNVAGFGLDGETVHRVNKTSKALGGFISFFWGTISALLAHRSLPLKLEIDGVECYDGMITMVAVANGQFFGSAMQIAPSATLDSGHFSIVLIKAMSKLDLLYCLPTIYKGTHVHKSQVVVFVGKRVIATSSGKVLLDIDGEQPGHLNAEFSILPACLSVIL